jgi:hypothetical protein
MRVLKLGAGNPKKRKNDTGCWNSCISPPKWHPRPRCIPATLIRTSLPTPPHPPPFGDEGWLRARNLAPRRGDPACPSRTAAPVVRYVCRQEHAANCPESFQSDSGVIPRWIPCNYKANPRRPQRGTYMYMEWIKRVLQRICSKFM